MSFLILCVIAAASATLNPVSARDIGKGVRILSDHYCGSRCPKGLNIVKRLHNYSGCKGGKAVFCVEKNLPAADEVRIDRTEECDRLNKASALANPDCCGFDVEDVFAKRERTDGETDANRIYNGINSAAANFPWLVRFYYQVKRIYLDESRRNRSVVMNVTSTCSGFLVGSQYVLSAQHCFYAQDNNPPKFVGIECKHNETEGKYEDCKKIIKIVKTFKYDTDIGTPPPDIILLKLEEKTNYTDTVRPVCLPGPALQATEPREYLVAGWGKTETNMKNDTSKKHAFISPYNHTACGNEMRISCNVEKSSSQHCPRIKYNGMSEFVCAKSNHSDVCAGDSGGPLIHYNAASHQHIAVGIISGNTHSKTTSTCYLGNAHAYTSIKKFMNWINHIATLHN